MEIVNYKLIEFLNKPKALIDEYLIILRYLKSTKTERKIINMKLKHVEYIKQSINSGNDKDLITIVSKVQKISEKKVLDIPIIKFFRLVASIKKQLNVIIKAETNGLSPIHLNQKWEMVKGAERMSRFGIYNTLESLSGGDALKYKKYMNMQYSEIFTILLMRKTSSDIQHEMNQIKTK